MAILYSLCSGSKGNATYVGDKSKGILIDAGIGIRNFTKFMSMADIDLKSIKSILITHEHSDHVKGLSKIAEVLDVPVIASLGTLEQIIEKKLVKPTTKLYELDKKQINLFDMEVHSFNTSHDSSHSLGYKIKTSDNKTVSVCTDLGVVTQQVQDALFGSDAVLIESNYDEEMLRNGAYPLFLKKRIASNYGHLSNEDCAKLIYNLLENGTNNFLLGHLSEQNNLPDLALSKNMEYLNINGATCNKDYKIEVAPKNNDGKVIVV